MSVDEWDQRELCPDGACTGVIGRDGTCKVCGHVATNWGDERTRGLKEEPAAAAEEPEAEATALEDESDYDGEDYADEDDDEYEEDEDDEADENGDAPSDNAGHAAASGWEDDRQLCPDGTCIGVIGDDGKCKVCGTRAIGAVARLVVDIETSDAVETTDDVVRTVDDNVKTPDAPPADPDDPEAPKA